MQLRDACTRANLTFEEFMGPSYLRLRRVEELQLSGRLDDELRWRMAVAAGR